MKLKKITHTHWEDENKQEYTFEPVEDSVQKTKEKDGTVTVKYLTQDEDPQSPGEYADDCVFLVNYHRDFWVEKKDIMSEDDLKHIYRGEKKEVKSLLDKYHVFPLSSLVHSGVWLRLGQSGFDSDPGGWDTSHVGAVMVCKDEFKTEKNARDVADGVVDEWNSWLSGDVYCTVKEKYKDGKRVDYDIVCGYYKHKDALEELKNL